MHSSEFPPVYPISFQTTNHGIRKLDVPFHYRTDNPTNHSHVQCQSSMKKGWIWNICNERLVGRSFFAGYFISGIIHEIMGHYDMTTLSFWRCQHPRWSELYHWILSATKPILIFWKDGFVENHPVSPHIPEKTRKSTFWPTLEASDRVSFFLLYWNPRGRIITVQTVRGCRSSFKTTITVCKAGGGVSVW